MEMSRSFCHQLRRVSNMAHVQLLVLLMLSCVLASAGPPRRLPPCRVVQRDVLCSDLSLLAAPVNLPHGVQMLDLSGNQVQNLTQETLAFHTDFHHLNLRSNKIHFIQPGLFRDMSDLKVLDLSRNHLNVFAQSKINVGPLTSVESLDLSSNGLYTGMSDYFLTDSPSLTNLSLKGNSITKITHNTFSGSVHLTKINLHNNVILEIEDGAFDSLRRLTELDLSKNSISCITDFNLYNLEVLNLSKNSVEFFQSARTSLVFNLLHLDLSENKMLYFPSLPRSNVLEHLDISRNHLQSTNASGRPEKRNHVLLKHLRYLDMSFNRLRNIPESFFCFMSSLQVLNVSNNCIGSFSISLEGFLPSVKIINLSYNSLQSLTFGENTLGSLEKLFLQGNQLTTLDQRLFQNLPNIRFLQLQQNNLKMCSPEEMEGSSDCVSFSSVHNLHFLFLSENNLRTLPADAFVNTSLELLDLSLNSGLELHRDSLRGLELSLVHLLLKENNMSRLDVDLSTLRRLKHVDLSTNQLTSLPAWRRESSIESLNLRNNHLVSLESGAVLALEPALKTLYVGSNPLNCCSSLGFLHMVRRSAVVVADLDTVTCLHRDFARPVSIEKLTEGMCEESGHSTYVIIIVVVVLVAMVIVSGLLVRRWISSKRKRTRGFNA